MVTSVEVVPTTWLRTHRGEPTEIRIPSNGFSRMLNQCITQLAWRMTEVTDVPIAERQPIVISKAGINSCI
jgi:hypothetical protein